MVNTTATMGAGTYLSWLERMGKISKVLEKSGYSHNSKESSIIPHGKNGEPKGENDSVATGVWDERLLQGARFHRETFESFRLLRSKILHPLDGRPVPKSIMVTSAQPQEGKSYVTANLGIALAQGVDQHSLLVDCDLRLPTLAGLFGLGRKKGLVDFLAGKCSVEELIVRSSVEKLSLIPSGTPPVNPAELLASVRMHDLVEELSSRYPDRFVLFDSPPMQVASESIVLSQAVDGVILVVRQGRTPRAVLDRVIDDIGRHKIMGVVFNAHKSNFIMSRLVDKSYSAYGNYYDT